MADHKAMSTGTLLDNIKGSRFNLLRRLDNHLNNLGRECRLILLSNDVRGWDIAPGSVCSCAVVNSDTLVCELGGPLICFG